MLTKCRPPPQSHRPVCNGSTRVAGGLDSRRRGQDRDVNQYERHGFLADIVSRGSTGIGMQGGRLQRLIGVFGLLPVTWMSLGRVLLTERGRGMREAGDAGSTWKDSKPPHICLVKAFLIFMII